MGRRLESGLYPEPSERHRTDVQAFSNQYVNRIRAVSWIFFKAINLTRAIVLERRQARHSKRFMKMISAYVITRSGV